MDDLISRQAAIDMVEESRRLNHHQDGKEACAHEYEHRHFLKILSDLPPAQPEPDWDYSEETKQITLIVPEDVYNSAETIFLTVGYEGTFGIRGMVYSAQPSSHCRNCKHWTRTCGDEQWGLGDCDVFDKHLVMCNGYCAWAERREV